MAYIYAYAPDEEDCSTIGLAGALMDEDAVFDLRAGEFGELTFEHPVDPYGKWRALVDGAILKTMVPVRLCPEVKAEGGYAETVDVYTVSDAATKNERYIYSKPEGGKKKRLLPAGAQVTVTGVADAAADDSRYRVKCGRYSGYMARRGLDLTRQGVPVAADASGIESVQPSYAVRQQLFRIYDVRPESGPENPGRLRVSARRIAYDLLGNLTEYKDDGNVSCAQACRGILENTLVPHDFSVYTDMGETRPGFDAREKNPIQALIDPEDGAAARWGAQVVSDDYDLYLLRRAGLSRGVEIRHGKNLLGVRMEADSSSAASALRPAGEAKDGSPLYLDGRRMDGRYGYNYDARRDACLDWLPEGYRFMTLPDGRVCGSVIERDAPAPFAVPRIARFAADGAKVEKSGSDVTEALARRRMARAAVERFEAGCDVPALKLEVDFVLLGDTAEYAQYRHLEPMFIYDTVRIVNGKLGISADVALTAIKWQVRRERVSAAAFGALQSLAAPVSTWQLPAFSGGKLLPGTVGAGQLGENAVDARHLQAESVNARALQAGCVTTEKLVSGAVTAEKLCAGAISADHIAAGAVQTGHLEAGAVTADKLAAGAVTADKLEAGCVTADKIRSHSVTADRLKAGLITAECGLIANGAIGSAQIADSSITSAKIVSLNADVIDAGTLKADRLLIGGEDGLIYRINATQAGLSAEALAEAEYRRHLSGTVIAARSVTADRIAAQAITGNEIAAGAVKAAHIDAASLFASEAFVEALNTSAIVGDQSLRVIAGRAEDARTAAEAAQAGVGEVQDRLDAVAARARSTGETLEKWFDFTEAGLVTSQPEYTDAAGVEHGRSIWSTLVDNTGFHIRRADLAEYIGSFHRDRLRVKNLEIGGVLMKASSRGGMVWVKG